MTSKEAEDQETWAWEAYRDSIVLSRKEHGLGDPNWEEIAHVLYNQKLRLYADFLRLREKLNEFRVHVSRLLN